MTVGIVLAFIVLGAGLLAVFHTPAPLAPHRKRETGSIADFPPELRRRMERFIEERAGRGAASPAQLSLVLLAATLGSGALLFPFYQAKTIVPALGSAFVVGFLYLQAQRIKHYNRLDEQTLDVLLRVRANLSGSARVAPSHVIGEILAETDSPLREEIDPILPPLQAGKEFLPALEAVLEETPSKPLQRFLHHWRASEEEMLPPEGQAARFTMLHELLLEEQRLRHKVLQVTQQISVSIYAVVGIIPALIALMMVMSPEYRTFYPTPIGQAILGLVLGTLAVIVLGSQWIIRQQQK